MRIQGISLSVPSRVVGNNDILNELRRRNSHQDAEEVEALKAGEPHVIKLTVVDATGSNVGQTAAFQLVQSSTPG